MALLCFLAPQLCAAAPGDHFSVSPSRLPAPHTTHPDSFDSRFVSVGGAMVTPAVPEGFTVSVFASGLKNARWLTVAANGDVFLAQTNLGRITLLRDADGDGKAEFSSTFADGLELPHGLAIRRGGFYVADVRAIWRYAYKLGDTTSSGRPRRITAARDLRPDGWHTTRTIVFDSKGTLYLAMGSRDDVSEDPPPDATVQIVHADGTMSTFASGLRNAVGLAFYPGTDELWATVNERDTLGGNLPPDYLAHLRKGDFLGWPYAYTGRHPDPGFGSKRPDMVARSKTPELLFQAHSAPLGLAFYTGSQFPPEYAGNAFVALHGPGPYGNPNGFKVVRVRFAGGNPVGGYEDFATGFGTDGRKRPAEWWAVGTDGYAVWGRPTGLAVAMDGSLLIADDTSGTVWRVSYTGKKH